EAVVELASIEQLEHAGEGVVGRDAIGELEEGLQPLVLGAAVGGDLDGGVAAGGGAAQRDDEDIDQEMLLIASLTAGVGGGVGGGWWGRAGRCLGMEAGGGGDPQGPPFGVDRRRPVRGPSGRGSQRRRNHLAPPGQTTQHSAMAPAEALEYANRQGVLHRD